MKLPVCSGLSLENDRALVLICFIGQSKHRIRRVDIDGKNIEDILDIFTLLHHSFVLFFFYAFSNNLVLAIMLTYREYRGCAMKGVLSPFIMELT